jgi:hypothetical protein
MTTINLVGVRLEDVRKALVERSKQNSFISSEDRARAVEILCDYQYEWLHDGSYSAIQLMQETNFGYDSITDDELLEEGQQYIDDAIDIDESSDAQDIFMANFVAKYTLEKALFHENSSK